MTPGILYFDCFSGASGDMLLGALVDAGLPFEALEAALRSLPVGDVPISMTRVERSGIGATKITVGEVDGHAPPEHHHHHDDSPHHHVTPEHHHHRGLAEICDIVDRADLTEPVKARATRLFRRLAEIEADIHQQPIEHVHLHEVGAVDSIVDIVGGVFGLEWFGAARVVSSPLNVGSGTVTCAHGVMPVPAPATARLVEGVPVYARGPAVELLTPTGALLVTEYADAYGVIPAMRVTASGYGAGERDFADHPNLLRVLLGDVDASDTWPRVVVIECEIDDMNPQIFGVLMERLYEAGALEVFYASIQMKKNRPGTLVTIVADPRHRDALSGIMFAETTTLGVRFLEMERECLDRELVSVDTPAGTVRVKVARRHGAVVNAAPEFDDCALRATEAGMSVKAVQALAAKAYLDRA